jgi:hypothetical protein
MVVREPPLRCGGAKNIWLRLLVLVRGEVQIVAIAGWLWCPSCCHFAQDEAAFKIWVVRRTVILQEAGRGPPRWHRHALFSLVATRCPPMDLAPSKGTKADPDKPQTGH